MKLAARDYEGACRFKVDPLDYTSSREFALDYAVWNLIKKFPDFPGSSKKSEVALDEFVKCEEDCGEINRRFQNIDLLFSGLPRPYVSAMLRAKERIRSLLGRFSWDKVEPYFCWGPGSTTRLAYKRRHGVNKFGFKPDTTLDNSALAITLILSDVNWMESAGGLSAINSPYDVINVVLGSRVTTVPKDAFKDRVIAIEPDMNMFVQKGFGGYIRKVLKRVSVDLDDQSRNQEYARLASSTGRFATLDLSCASDTIAYEVVKFLLPYDWFEAMLHCRSSYGTLPSGRVFAFEKFSSMGNGFTFELESLIFWAICSEAVSLHHGYRDVAVFGDDLVVPSPCYSDSVRLLSLFGFRVNRSKSYRTGPFRESCGKHYWNGVDVTPPRLTKPILRVSDVFRAHNKLMRFSARLGYGLYRDRTLKPMCDLLAGMVPRRLRYRIPDGFGDGGLVSSFDEALPSRAPNGFDGWSVPSLLPNRRVKKHDGVGALLHSLNMLSKAREHTEYPPSWEGSSNCYVSSRHRRHPLCVKWSFVGPWLDVA
jgi:hypothetical protein